MQCARSWAHARSHSHSRPPDSTKVTTRRQPNTSEKKEMRKWNEDKSRRPGTRRMRMDKLGRCILHGTRGRALNANENKRIKQIEARKFNNNNNHDATIAAACRCTAASECTIRHQYLVSYRRHQMCSKCHGLSFRSRWRAASFRTKNAHKWFREIIARSAVAYGAVVVASKMSHFEQSVCPRSSRPMLSPYRFDPNIGYSPWPIVEFDASSACTWFDDFGYGAYWCVSNFGWTYTWKTIAKTVSLTLIRLHCILALCFWHIP